MLSRDPRVHLSHQLLRSPRPFQKPSGQARQSPCCLEQKETGASVKGEKEKDYSRLEALNVDLGLSFLYP